MAYRSPRLLTAGAINSRSARGRHLVIQVDIASHLAIARSGDGVDDEVEKFRFVY